MARTIATTIGPVDRVVHSGARRTERLAAMIARRVGCPVMADPRWQERDFAAWEGRTWQAIWRESGDLMDRMMTDPNGFRPGGGETGGELSRRAQAAWDALPLSGTTLVVAHGGPIAAIRCRFASAPLERMVGHVPACGETVALART